MIEESEILKHLAFFQKCEKDHQILAEKLITELSDKLNVIIDLDNPIRTFRQFYTTSSKGQMNNWNYYFHGHHCYFENFITQQNIEVSLFSGKNFGALDQVFFLRYIISTKEYYPLPINNLEPNTDGATIVRILKQLKTK